MDWDNIRVFLAVARGGHFSAAASTLQMDNATVGRRIVALEKSLGCRLFDRRPTGSVLTVAGERLLGAAEIIESNLLRAQRDLSQSDSELSGAVRIAAPDGFGTLFLCPLLAGLKRQYPALTIQLVTMSRTLSLSKREADLAIMIDRPEEGRLSIRRLIDYSLHFYATQDYLDRHAPPRSLDDLAEHSVVTYVQDLLFADRLNFVPELFRPEYSRFECATAIGQMAAVRAGAGIGILHDYAVHGDPTFRMVLPDVSFTRSYWMATHQDVVGLARVKAVAEHISAGLKAQAAVFNITA